MKTGATTPNTSKILFIDVGSLHRQPELGIRESVAVVAVTLHDLETESSVDKFRKYLKK
jgi:hypothetical protein